MSPATPPDVQALRAMALGEPERRRVDHDMPGDWTDLAERFRADPFSHPPPCLKQPDKPCLPYCECGFGKSCKREETSHAE